jgi:hypothetical protein
MSRRLARWISLLKIALDKSEDIILMEAEKRLLVLSGDSHPGKLAREILRKNGLDYQVDVASPAGILHGAGGPGLLKILAGYSLKKSRSLAGMLGAKSRIIAIYSLKNLDHSKKTIFGYALKGRKNSGGVLREIGGEVAGRNSVIVPAANSGRLEGFFSFWNVAFTVRQILEFGENKVTDGAKPPKKEAKERVHNGKD